jgi:hypothetical protein
MVDGSFFSGIARYAAPSGPDQRENRLTAIFSAVLDQQADAGLPGYLVDRWLRLHAAVSSAGSRTNAIPILEKPIDQYRCHVASWTRTLDQKIPDLHIRFEPASGSSATPVTIWVEVKHGADPHPGQLEGYLGEAGAVVLLGPRDDLPGFSVPAGVVEVSWQQTAVALREYGDTTDDPIARFLIDQLCGYLKQEGLMDPDQVTPAHFIALAEHSEAIEAVRAACEHAAEYVGARWRFEHPYQLPPFTKSEAGWAYLPEPIGEAQQDWGPWGLGWGIFRDGHEIFPRSELKRGVPVFHVGMYSPDPAARRALEADETWRKRLNEQPPFVYLPRNVNVNFRRLAYPEEVLAGRTVKDQGEHLGAWVDAGFCALYEAGPPPGTRNSRG